MFEGHNELVLCKEATCKLFSEFLSDKFGLSIEVEDITSSSYSGVKIEFTQVAKTGEPKKAEEPQAVQPASDNS